MVWSLSTDQRSEVIQMIAELRGLVRTSARRRVNGLMFLSLFAGLTVSLTVLALAYSVLLRPLPVVEADTLALVYESLPSTSSSRLLVSYPKYWEWRRRATAF